MAMTSYERVKKWRERHKDEWLAQAKAYREKHPDVIRAIRKRYYERKRVKNCRVSAKGQKAEKSAKLWIIVEFPLF